MGVKTAKLITVPANGQISIGSSWAGKQICVEEVNDSEIHISAGTFIPDSQKVFFTKEAQQRLNDFNKWENKEPANESTQHELVICDLEYSLLHQDIQDLELVQLEQFEKTIKKIQQMTWDQIYKTSSKSQKRGLNWEPIQGQKTASGKIIASLHPDHDSAYYE